MVQQHFQWIIVRITLSNDRKRAMHSENELIHVDQPLFKSHFVKFRLIQLAFQLLLNHFLQVVDNSGNLFRSWHSELKHDYIILAIKC